MILVDTDAWIRHFQQRDPRLSAAIGNREVGVHPLVLNELYLGAGIPKQLLMGLERMEQPKWRESDAAVRSFIFRYPVRARGLGWVDACLLSSAVGWGLDLWTHDRSLAAAAKDIFGVQTRPNRARTRS